MWCPPGYILLSEVRSILDRYAQWKIHQLDIENTWEFSQNYTEGDAYTDWLVMSFLVTYSPEIRITLPSGAIVRIASPCFQPDVYYDQLEYLMEQTPETLGLAYQTAFDFDFFRSIYANFPQDLVGRMKAADFSFAYIDTKRMVFLQPKHLQDKPDGSLEFLNSLPLCISLSDIPLDLKSFVSKIEAGARVFWRETEDFPSSEKSRAAELIVDAMRTGIITKKSEAKRHYGKGMKTEEFRATWDEVVKAIPEASKPGPRRRSDNS